MLEKGSSRSGGTFFKMSFHLSMTSVQKRLLTLNVCPPGEVGGGYAKKKIGSWVGISKNLQMSVDKCVLFSQESCRDAQCVVRGGTPKPPHAVGVKIIFFDNLCLFPFIKLTMILSISFLVAFGGRGKMVAMCVNLDNKHVFVMLTFAVCVSFSVDQAPISDLIAFIAFSQLSCNLSRFPVR